MFEKFVHLLGKKPVVSKSTTGEPEMIPIARDFAKQVAYIHRRSIPVALDFAGKTAWVHSNLLPPRPAGGYGETSDPT